MTPRWRAALAVAGLISFVAGLLVFLARYQAYLPTDGSCGMKGTGGRRVALSSMHIATPLYVFLDHGRFVRRDLRSGIDTVLSDHGFGYGPTVLTSADGRWISYSGQRVAEQGTQYWLYDRKTGSDRLVMQHAAWGGSVPDFSPDGRFLVISANYDDRWPDASAAGTYVFATDSLHATRLGIPASLPASAAWTFHHWSQDGTALLLVTRDSKSSVKTSEYRQWHAGASTTEPIEGRWIEPSPGQSRHAWFADGLKIPLFEQAGLQGDQGPSPAASPDGEWTPRVESVGAEEVLMVTGRDGKARRVDGARHDECVGMGIAAIGWIDAGHLVYRKSDYLPLVYELSSGNIAPLLDGDVIRTSFGW